MPNQPQSIRLNKYLAERLGVSRREADALIASGKITVDGVKPILGTKVDSRSRILCNGKPVPSQADYVYLAFHKPVGYVCSRHAQGKTPTIYELLPAKYHKLKTVGRLDKDSSGLILLTNDGDFSYRLTHPKFHKTKIYQVELDRPLAPFHQQMISDFGLMLEDGPSRFTIIRDGDHYVVTLTEGRNRQIRRTFAALGYKVTKLHRTDFGPYALGALKPGSYQHCAALS